MNNEITCTLNVLSRCHLTEKEWKPEDLSPLGLMALKTKLNARHRDEEIKAAPRVKDGYVKPQTWTAEQRRNLNKWRDEMGRQVGDSGRLATRPLDSYSQR